MIGLNFGFGPVEAEFWRWMFTMTRIAAALFAAPLFGAASVPPQVRLALSSALAVFACAWLPIAAPAPLLSAAGLIAVAGEVLIGLSLGFVLQFGFTAPMMAAEVIGGVMGMSIATGIDPSTGAQSPALGQYFRVVLTLVFFGMGAHIAWIGLLIDSYRVFPPGQTWLGADRIAMIVGFAGEMFLAAVTMALPVVLVLLLVQIVTGVLGRAAPALNLFALGLPAGVLAAIAALIIAAPLFTDGCAELVQSILTQAAAVLKP
jgi:flagellar biosynthetic protein FliR